MILLVEDDAISRMDFAQKLRAFDYKVMEAADGAEAIELLEKHSSSIELVITDMVLPKVHGFNLVMNIQARWPQVPVIMLSAYLSKERGEAIIGHSIDVLEKPVRPSALIAVVQRHLPHSHS